MGAEQQCHYNQTRERRDYCKELDGIGVVASALLFSLFEILHSRNRDFSQFEQDTSTNLASFTFIEEKTFS